MTYDLRIFKEYMKGNLTFRDFAKEQGISPNNASHIIHRTASHLAFSDLVDYKDYVDSVSPRNENRIAWYYMAVAYEKTYRIVRAIRENQSKEFEHLLR